MLVTERAKKRIEWLNKHYPHNVRLAIQSGGRSEFRCEFDMDERHDGDILVGDILVDPVSAEFLQDAVVDYVADFTGLHFHVEAPQVRNSCGCSKSFSNS